MGTRRGDGNVKSVPVRGDDGIFVDAHLSDLTHRGVRATTRGPRPAGSGIVDCMLTLLHCADRLRGLPAQRQNVAWRAQAAMTPRLSPATVTTHISISGSTAVSALHRAPPAPVYAIGPPILSRRCRRRLEELGGSGSASDRRHRRVQRRSRAISHTPYPRTITRSEPPILSGQPFGCLAKIGVGGSETEPPGPHRIAVRPW